MIEEFIVKYDFDATVDNNADMTAILKTMGSEGYRTMYTGRLACFVEIENRVTIKKRINWAPENDPNFKAVHEKNATALLDALEKAVAGGPDPGNGKIIYVVKK